MNFRFLILAGLIFFIFLYIVPLGVRPAIIPDETRYSEIPREMLASGDWVVPRLDGLRYFEKPVLGYWLNALSMKLFGQNDFANRLPAASAALLSALLVFFAVKRFFNRETALFAAFILLTFQEFFWIACFNVLDSLLSFCVCATLIFFFFAYSETENFLKRCSFLFLCGIFAGAAFLTKGFLAFAVPVLTIVPFLIWEKKYRQLFTMPWIPLAAAILVSMPWCIAIHIRESDYWNYFFWFEHVNRFFSSSPEFQHPSPVWFFIPVLAIGALPWTFLFPAAAKAFDRTDLKTPLVRYCICWFLFSFFFFSFSSGKLPTYILPFFPSLAILTALWLRRYLSNGGSKLFDIPAKIFSAIALLAALILLINRLSSFPEPIFASFEGSECFSAMTALLFAAAAMFAASKNRHPDSKVLIFGTAVFLIMMSYHFILPERVRLTKAPGSFLLAQSKNISPDSIIVTYKNLVHAVCWYYKRADAYIFMEKGELSYGLKYTDSQERFLDVDRLLKLIDKNRGQRPVFLILRTKIFEEDCKGKLPQPSVLVVDGDYTVAKYF